MYCYRRLSSSLLKSLFIAYKPLYCNTFDPKFLSRQINLIKISLSFRNANLFGTIPSELSFMKKLELLDSSENLSTGINDTCQIVCTWFVMALNLL